MTGQPIPRCEPASFSALKTVSPSLDQLIGRVSAGCSRRGKYVCFDLDGMWLVTHLARAGFIRWHYTVPATTARPAKTSLAIRVGLDNGSEFDQRHDLTVSV
jgi:formamidopyrimidine-DNA glycosylase